LEYKQLVEIIAAYSNLSSHTKYSSICKAQHIVPNTVAYTKSIAYNKNSLCKAQQLILNTTVYNKHSNQIKAQ